jgi:predicted acyl esterase
LGQTLEKLIRPFGTFTPAPAVGSGAVEYTYDPRDPTPTVGGAISSGEPVMHAGAFDQSGAARRSDVMVFATPPLEEELPSSP